MSDSRLDAGSWRTSAGTTTIAGLLAARSVRAGHLKSDRFLHPIRSGYVQPWKPESHEQNRVVMGIVAAPAAAYAAGGYFTIMDGIVLPTWFFKALGDALGGQSVAYSCSEPRYASA
jgi:hypothetical protein